MSINENLEKLSNACGVTGRESEVRELMIRLMTPYADEIVVDKLENVIAVKKGKPDAPKIMLAAHMDEVGLMVKTITKDGFLQFAKMGGIDDRILPAQKVTVFSRKGHFPASSGQSRHISKKKKKEKNLSLRRTFH